MVERLDTRVNDTPGGLLSPRHNAQAKQVETPAHNAGGFFVDPSDKEQALQNYHVYEAAPNKYYDRYMRMHKGLVGEATVGLLREISDNLQDSHSPRYLIVAGSAASEAALIAGQHRTEARLELLDRAAACWKRAVGARLSLNEQVPEEFIEHAAPYRISLDLAMLPLMQGIVERDVTEEACNQAYLGALAVAQANIVQLDLALKENTITAIADHVGFGYECNALLALNGLRSQTWFAIPAVARADTGYHHAHQTHDLLVIRQKWGVLRSVIPAEIKSAASLRDRNRYLALLVRGKMHLSAEGQYAPRTTLEAFTASEQGTATKGQKAIIAKVTGQFLAMLNDYYHGDPLDSQAVGRTNTMFRDNSIVAARHPGLAKIAAS